MNLNVEEGSSPLNKNQADVSLKGNKHAAREGMTAADLETFLRDLYDFYLFEGIYGGVVADRLLELEDKISFLKLGNEATA